MTHLFIRYRSSLYYECILYTVNVYCILHIYSKAVFLLFILYFSCLYCECILYTVNVYCIFIQKQYFTSLFYILAVYILHVMTKMTRHCILLKYVGVKYQPKFYQNNASSCNIYSNSCERSVKHTLFLVWAGSLRLSLDYFLQNEKILFLT